MGFLRTEGKLSEVQKDCWHLNTGIKKPRRETQKKRSTKLNNNHNNNYIFSFYLQISVLEWVKGEK